MSQTVAQLRKTKHLVINHQQQQEHRNQPELGNVDDPLLDIKIEDVTSGLTPHFTNVLRKVLLSNKDML
jgi:hypothetical protein